MRTEIPIKVLFQGLEICQPKNSKYFSFWLPTHNKNLLNGMYLEAKIFCKGFENVVAIPRKYFRRQYHLHS